MKRVAPLFRQEEKRGGGKIATFSCVQGTLGGPHQSERLRRRKPRKNAEKGNPYELTKGKKKMQTNLLAFPNGIESRGKKSKRIPNM